MKNDEWQLDRPVNELVHPFGFVRRGNFDVIVGIAFHHAAFVVALEQYLTCLPCMLLREVLHFHVAEVAQSFIALVADVHWDHRLYFQCFGIVALRVSEHMQIRNIQPVQKR